MRRSTRALGIFAVASVALAGMGLAVMCSGDDCYEDLIVTDAGIDITRGTYSFQRMVDGRAFFANDAGVHIEFWGGSWRIFDGGETYYVHSSRQGVTPPASGWELGVYGDVPYPSISQPRECGPPPTLTSVSLRTNPWNNEFVEPGESIVVSFRASKLLADMPRVRILGNTAGVSRNGASGLEWRATYRPTVSDPEGPVTFTIDYEDWGGQAGPQFTEADASDVYILDRTPPTIPVKITPEDGATVEALRVYLEWQESTDEWSDRILYRVYVGSLVEFVVMGTTSYLLHALPEGTYTWDVLAFDDAGNESPDFFPGTFTVDIPDGELVVIQPHVGSFIDEGAECAYVGDIGLSSAPTADVEVTMTLSDQLQCAGCEPGSPFVLTFTPSDWQSRPVCLIAVDDDVYEGTQYQRVDITTTSEDPIYDNQNGLISLHIVDNEPILYGVTITPAGASGGFLDCGLPEGQAPVTIGGYTLAAVCEIGTALTGGLVITNSLGDPLRDNWFTVVLQPLRLEEAETWVLRPPEAFGMGDWERDVDEYRFEVDTGGLDPGYYVVVLTFEDGTTTREIFIELVAGP